MKFKKIYLEITNICNLHCSFCSQDNRKLLMMTAEDFEKVIQKIDTYTDYIYLHVKGEPLLHNDLEKILFIADKYHKKVCLTTNGTLLKEKLHILKKFSHIYQINISLHSENAKENYLEDIFYAVSKLDKPYISYRFWTLEEGRMDSRTKKYLDMIKKEYHVSEVFDKVKLKEHVYLSLEEKFTWPNLHNSYYCEKGRCLGGKSHLAILSDGTVTICCLDSEGDSNLGNIFTELLEDILSKEQYQSSIKDFQNNKAYLEICKHCSYKERFNKEGDKNEKS